LPSLGPKQVLGRCLLFWGAVSVRGRPRAVSGTDTAGERGSAGQAAVGPGGVAILSSAERGVGTVGGCYHREPAAERRSLNVPVQLRLAPTSAAPAACPTARVDAALAAAAAPASGVTPCGVALRRGGDSGGKSGGGRGETCAPALDAAADVALATAATATTGLAAAAAVAVAAAAAAAAGGLQGWSGWRRLLGASAPFSVASQPQGGAAVRRTLAAGGGR